MTVTVTQGFGKSSASSNASSLAALKNSLVTWAKVLTAARCVALDLLMRKRPPTAMVLVVERRVLLPSTFVVERRLRLRSASKAQMGVASSVRSVFGAP